VKIFKISHNDKLLESVIDLGNKNAKTLGFFPEGAFREHARTKNILVVTNDEEFVGYLLFRITQKTRVISITHLCISSKFRGQDYASKLLDHLKAEYQHVFRGFKLNCRKDYDTASKFWENYGFKAVSEKRSRSKEERYLVKWWYDFGNKNLFSFSYSSSSNIEALLDASVIIKLRDQKYVNRKEIEALYADWLIDEVDYYYAPEIYNEIKRDKDKSRISETRSFMSAFKEARFKPQKRDNILLQVEGFLTGNSVNDISDRKQLSECIAAGIDYFITTDENILSVKEKIFETFSLNILRPTDFILFIDELVNGMNYQSYRVAGANYDYKKISHRELDSLVEKFLNYSAGERKHLFRDKLTKIASQPNKTEFRLIKDSKDECIGFYATSFEESKARVDAIRCGKSSISDTLFQQVLYDLIKQGVSKQLDLIEIHEEYFNQKEKNILASFGFIEQQNCWIRFIFSGLRSTKEILSNQLVQEYLNVGQIEKKLRILSEDDAKDIKFNIEQKFWPLKFSNLKLPVYIIPIKPFWAAQLFDFILSQSSIFGSNPKLSWSKENIYYRSVRPVSEQAPARILWYISSNKSNKYSDRQKGITACSYLEEVHIDTAKQLFSKFKNYGIYSWSNISEMTDDNSNEIIKALKFSYTEVFDNIIELQEIHRVFNNHGRPKNSFVSPVKVSHDVFQALYKKGINIDE
jgi:ribosomal protein S18 acetylase RimI-like enzyme/AraC-like DNA-binding protein